MRRDPPDFNHVRDICLIGQGEKCCRYLAMSPHGWSCEKLTPARFVLDDRVAAGSMYARGDNCDGRGDQ